MGLKRNDPRPKPIEEWTAKEWEVAYNLLAKKHEDLRDRMRRAIMQLNAAI